jgi:hypothetical protein
MRESLLAMLGEQDTFAVVQYLNQQPDALVVGNAYADLVKHLYWQKKDIEGVAAIARAGIQHCLCAAMALDDPTGDRAIQLRSLAKTMAFDLGSFTWPGWDEPGIVLCRGHLVMGLDAAMVNLRLAHELNKGDLPTARACWLLGAHYLAVSENGKAGDLFEEAARYSRAAENDGEALLADGYRCLAALLQSPEDSRPHQDLTAIQALLAEKEGGAGFIEQLETALRVFSQHDTNQ